MQNRDLILKKSIKNLTTSRILDVGCADAGFSDILFSNFKASSIIGVDLSKKEIHFAKCNELSSNLDYVRADVTALPFSLSSFDLVFAKDLLHHLNRPTRALREFKQILKKKGTLIVVEAERTNPFMSLYIRLGHNHFTLPQLSNLISKADLRNYKVEKVSAYPHHFLFMSGNLFELIWDSYLLFFLSICSIFPSITKYFVKIVSSTTPHSYNIVIWRNEK